MKEWENADIKLDVCLNNSEESNLFLRAFYEELNKHGIIGWSFQSFRDGNVIYIGDTNYGEMWIEYKERGKISKVYFKTKSENSQDCVKTALNYAKENYNKLKIFTITTCFETSDIMFCDMRRNGIHIYPMEENGSKFVNIIFPVYAFGAFDLKYVVTQKINYLKHLLCAYTNTIFPCIRVTWYEGTNEAKDNCWKEPDDDWIDFDELFIDYGNNIIALSSDFFGIFRIIIDTFEYKRDIRLLLNSSQEIYCSKMMIQTLLKNGGEWNIPGYTELINTLMISALEPLSNVYGVKPETCKACGNKKYSIRKKVRDLCSTYLPEHIAKDVYEKGYGQRSAFLHEGNPISNEFYCGQCIPLINPVDGRSILYPVAYLTPNLFDYVAFVFRKLACKILEDNVC